MQKEKLEFIEDMWPEVYNSRQNKTILTWPCIGMEEDEGVPCLVVTKERVKGLIPIEESGIILSEDDKVSRRRMMSLIGQEVHFQVTSVSKKKNIFIASRTKAIEKLSEIAWANFKEGEVKTVIARRTVRRMRPSGDLVDIGIYVEIDGIEIFLPVQEISYGWVGKISTFLQPGDIFDVKIMKVDKENKRLDLSLKALLEDPWPSAGERYIKNNIYSGEITGTTKYGVFLEIEPGVNMLCPHPKAGKVNTGDKAAVVITRIDPEERRINGVITRIIRKA